MDDHGFGRVTFVPMFIHEKLEHSEGQVDGQKFEVFENPCKIGLISTV
jgi:hypothetical protein